MDKGPEKTPPAPLRAAVDAILAEAKSVLSGAADTGATRTIHDFRVSMKRWRALLRLIEPFVGDEARLLRREATLLTRNLSPSRDVQASLDALRDIAKPQAGLDDLAADMRDAATARLSELRGQTEAGAFDEVLLKKLEAAVTRAAAQARSWPLEAIAFTDIAAGLARSYRRARRRRPASWHDASDETLHDMRKAIVTLRYQIEIVAPLWPRFWKVFSSELQKLRTQLGRGNDLAVLETLLRPRQPLARWRKHLAPRMAPRAQRHRRQAERIAGRALAETPRAFKRRLIALWQAGKISDEGFRPFT
jgi:CHAD domain-containing protein